MDMARYVVDAVVVEGRSCREVARSHGISKSWVAELVARFRGGGYDAIAKRSTRPQSIPTQTRAETEDCIVRLRKQLEEQGLDAGPQTIHHHLEKGGGEVPSIATIWRVLKRRGFVVAQPQKRPRSSYIRFEADLPNECWQSDVTVWRLAGGGSAEIINFVDDFSRLAIGSTVAKVTTAREVVEAFYIAAQQWGFPASVLTDNGCVYTAAHRNGRAAMETELYSLGIKFKHSRPYHPQTCGKVERFHQTLKKFLDKKPRANTVAELQRQVDEFIAYYNEVRPHRAKGRMTPREAFESRARGKPSGSRSLESKQMRVRHDKVNGNGTVTIRYRSRLHHIGLGRGLRGQRVTLLVADRDIRVLDESGVLIRELRLDPSRDYQSMAG